jgi:hypothetical protein
MGAYGSNSTDEIRLCGFTIDNTDYHYNLTASTEFNRCDKYEKDKHCS